MFYQLAAKQQNLSKRGYATQQYTTLDATTLLSRLR